PRPVRERHTVLHDRPRKMGMIGLRDQEQDVMDRTDNHTDNITSGIRWPRSHNIWRVVRIEPESEVGRAAHDGLKTPRRSGSADGFVVILQTSRSNTSSASARALKQ